MKDSKILNVAFKNYVVYKNYGASDSQFRNFLCDKCEDPNAVYRWVINRYKEGLVKKEKELEDRNEPFKPNKVLPTYLFAEKMCNKILGTNKLY